MKYFILPCFSYKEKNYSLFSFRRQDLSLIKRWRNDQINILRQDHLLSSNEQKAYYNNVIKPSFSQQFPKLILLSFLYDDNCIGYGGFTNIDWSSQRAEISFLIDTDRANNEILYRQDFSVFLTLLKRIAFNDLKFNRLFTETYDIRDKHIKILEKAGFRKEGVMREHVFINGEKVDSILHGFLKKYYND